MRFLRTSLWVFASTVSAFGAPLVFDLHSGPVPTYPGVAPDEVRLAALNFALHSISWEKGAKPAKRIAGGKAEVDPGLLSPDQVEFLRENNPYDCEKEKTAPFRVDWLVPFVTRRYHRLLLGPDPTYAKLQKKIGLPPDTNDPKFQWALFTGSESRIAASERSVGIVKGTHGPIALTVDTFRDRDKSPHPFHYRSGDKDGGELTTRAGEGIFTLPNGYQGFFLLSQDEGKEPELPLNAPAHLVRNNFSSLKGYRSQNFLSGKVDREKFDLGINLEGDCLLCHRGGWQGPARGLSLDRAKVVALLHERAKKVKDPAEKKELERFAAEYQHLSEKDYEEAQKKQSAAYVKTLADTQALVAVDNIPVPLLPDYAIVHKQQNVDLQQAAKELGTTPERLASLIDARKNDVEFLRRMYSTGDRNAVNVQGNVPFSNGSPTALEEFEHNFCFLQDLLAKEDAKSAPFPEGKPAAPLAPKPKHAPKDKK